MPTDAFYFLPGAGSIAPPFTLPPALRGTVHDFTVIRLKFFATDFTNFLVDHLFYHSFPAVNLKDTE